MTVIQIEKMNNKFGLHVYMPLVALISYILGNICLILEIQSIIYIIMYTKRNIYLFSTDLQHCS